MLRLTGGGRFPFGQWGLVATRGAGASSEARRWPPIGLKPGSPQLLRDGTGQSNPTKEGPAGVVYRTRTRAGVAYTDGVPGMPNGQHELAKPNRGGWRCI